MNEDKLTIRISPTFLARIDALRGELEQAYPHARRGRAGAVRILLDEAMARRERSLSHCADDDDEGGE